jgi:hypothetical protein
MKWAPVQDPEQRQASLASAFADLAAIDSQRYLRTGHSLLGDSHEYAKHIIQPHRGFQSA